jgi:hypothetical protein
MRYRPFALGLMNVLLMGNMTCHADDFSETGGSPMKTELKSCSPITLSAGNLTATFADNEAYGPVHKQRYNGISELLHRDAAENLFVPTVAGFNLEHLFGGDFLEELFEPRLHPMVLSQVDERTVRLHQSATPISRVESEHVFRMAPPNCIDVTVTFIFHDLAFFKHGYAGAFWASYINAPENRCQYFWGTTPGNPAPHWVESFSEKHGERSSHVFVREAFEPFFAENFNATLANHFSGNKFAEPFYFGLSGKMVYAIFFDRTEGLRFSQSPTGGGNTNPAWDHYFVVQNPEVGKHYGYRARVLYKPFITNDDVRAEFEAWRRGLEE